MSDNINVASMSTEEKIKLATQLLEDAQKESGTLYPAKPGEYVLMPPDARGRRNIRIVPASDAARSNLFAIPGVVAYKGAVPAEGFIVDERKFQTYDGAMPAAPREITSSVGKPIPSADTQPAVPAMPADFAQNIPTQLDAKGKLGALVAAIGTLKADGFTKNGLPQVQSLSDIVKWDVEAGEREEAFEEFKKIYPNWQLPTE